MVKTPGEKKDKKKVAVKSDANDGTKPIKKKKKSTLDSLDDKVHRSKAGFGKKKKRGEKSWVKALARKQGIALSKPKKRTTEESDGQPTTASAIRERMNQKYPKERAIFLRTIPLELEEEDVVQYIRRFGTIQRVMLVKDKITGKHRGSAFVYFRNEKSVTAALAEAQENLEQWLTVESAKQHNEEQQQTASTAGGSGSGIDTSNRLKKKAAFGKSAAFANKTSSFQQTRRTPFLYFGDHLVECMRPTSHETIEDKKAVEKENRVKAGTTTDARNLYLLMEGYIDPESQAAAGIPEHDLRQREEWFRSKCIKIRNPMYHVSRTRLCVRGIPLDLEDRKLSAIFAAYGPLLQVKLMRDQNYESKGYAFVEYKRHEDALTALRSVNNNPKVFGTRHRPAVEFAIDNIRILQRRNGTGFNNNNNEGYDEQSGYGGGGYDEYAQQQQQQY